MAEREPSDTTPAELSLQLAAASAAAGPSADVPPGDRAECLRTVADRLDAAADELVPLAMEETHLAQGRLSGELTRTTFQLQLFAQLLEEGSQLGVTIDHPDPAWPPGPRPDLRRLLVPLGPVVVFAASNFPFAFSVAGGDTASAWAAGCPVVLKAHPGHSRLSARTGTIVLDALGACSAPEGAFTVIYGEEAGRAAVTAEEIRAGAFTGSLAGGRALFDLAASRSTPIPFYAEMGSLNPVFVTAGAMQARGDEILAGYVESFTLSAGQFCTKPGLLFLPADTMDDGRLSDALDHHRAGAPLLNEHIHRGYVAQLQRLRHHPGVRTVVGDDESLGAEPTPTLLATSVPQLLAGRDQLLVECFGPTSVVVGYADDGELLGGAEAFGGQLTAAVHGEETEAVIPALVAILAARAGRVLWNGWPTGVSVTWAMEHGGPYPATTVPLHTSVGTAAIHRFLRPVSFQSVPDRFLPAALRDANPLGVPRRVDGLVGDR
jgi:NADP-dependent aldehyde dehydrogenase